MIPLIFMIQMERIQFIHSFLFSLVAELVPEITGSKKVIIVSDGEKAITNAISKTWINIPMFRCWIHAWRNMKLKLEKLCNTRETNFVSNYKADFINLLLQKSERSYKSVIARCYLKWNKVD